MVEDRDIILDALRWRRRTLCIRLNIGPGDGRCWRLELARINAEIARRCWNRIAIHAAKAHSPLS
jgi:hypothetical protein